MDKQEEISDVCKEFQNKILGFLQDTQRERDKYAKEYEDLQVLCDVVQEQLDEELKGNTVLRNTVEELKQRVMDLEQQLSKSEAERLKLAEKLKTLSKDADKENEMVGNFNQQKQVPEVKSQRIGFNINKKQQEEPEMMEDIGSFEDYSISTQFSPNKEAKVDKKSDEGSKMVSGFPKPLPPIIIPETLEGAIDTFCIDLENEKTPEKKPFQNVEASPVLSKSHQSNKKRKNSNNSLEGNGSVIDNDNTNVNNFSPIRVVSQETLLKPKNMYLTSPTKRPSISTYDIFSPVKIQTPKKSKKSPTKTPRKTPRKSLQKTPKKSPARLTQLKKSHLIDAERTFNGKMKKMTQTTLGNSFLKRKPNEKENETNQGNRPDLKDYLQASNDYMAQFKKENDEDDDFIYSPEVRSKSLTDFQTKQAKAAAGSSKVLTQPEVLSQPSQSLLADDPEATYVSNTFLANWKHGKLDDIPEEKPPIPKTPPPPKRHLPKPPPPPKLKDLSPTEKIPESDSPTHAYKRGPVRKRSERMGLPGHECFECVEYYKLAFKGDLNGKEYQKAVNKCSRHRDKHPDLNNTPPGYWKPYLTMTEEEF